MVFVRRAGGFREQPHLEREARGVGRDADEVLVFADDALAGIALLADDVAENATLFLVVIMPAVVDLFANAARDDGQSDELRVRMFEGSAGGFSVIFEDKDVTEAFVVFKIEHAVAVSPQNIFDGARLKSGERGHVVGRFDDDFVGADSVHFVEQAFAFAIEIAFDAERPEAIGNDANVPAGSVGAAAVAAVNKNLGRRFAFGSGAEGASLGPRDNHAFAEKIGGALSTIGGNDDPAARDGIFTQLRQSKPPRRTPIGHCLPKDCTASGAAFYS